MVKTVLTISLLLFSVTLFAQQARTRSQAPLPPPLPFREVSGIVKDPKGQTLSGATITLVSKKDTLKTSTNDDGIFVFKNVKMATFVITVKSIGFTTSVRRYLNNDAVKRIVLDPLVLKPETNMLNEVKINGAPSITYKTDTVEYRASDYKVRENATVDELLKKMEGMEVGSDGTLTHQGQQVTKARLNGKDYAGGNVAQAIQNLPADIVEKIQIVDDYGDQAGRTGIKDGDPTKVLNITTRADRSVGNIVRLTASDGNDDRYDERVFAQRINANQQIGIIGNIRNTVNGVASTGINSSASGQAAGSTSGGSGGTTTSGGPAFTYRDQWSKSIQVNASYRYTFNDVNSINNSTGQTFSSLGTTNFTRQNTGINNAKTHNASFELEYTPDSSNFLRVIPSFSYSGSNTGSNTQYNQTGLLNQYSNGISSSTNNTPTYGAVILYQYIFKKPRRNVSIQFNLTNGNQQQNTAQNTEIQYKDSLQTVVKDSLVHRTIDRSNITKNYRTSLTYVEPLSKLSQLEFNAQLNYRGYSNTAVTSNISPDGTASVIDSLSNIYRYSFTESRVSLNYRLTKTKYNLSIGATAIPSHLEGANVSKATSTNRNDFYVIPIFRFQYVWSRQHRISINYSGAPTEPAFTQIQPLPDFSDPQNPVFGNPDLRPSFRHSINTIYNNYISNSKLNLSANINTSFYEDQIVSNVVQVPQPALHSFLYETHYVNMSGARSVLANYNISKQSDDRAYNLALNGLISYGHSLGMSNNIQNVVTSWRFNERFGPRINPDDRIEINPYISYDINKSENTLPNSVNSNIKTTALSVDGRFFLLKSKTMTIGYSASKNYINGISSNISKNPLVVNGYFEQEFFKRKNGILRISAFDIFDQNNFINRVITQNSVTDTKTNALSRYVLISFILNLQKWSGAPSRNGRPMKRRGDGSFIY
ncbi:MAG: hypothetical protein JWR02_917 [Mucilaginibacter sp.]|nr:hypothetical protein [Mucilaginibacter sp.]